MIPVSQSLLTLWKPQLKTLEYLIPLLDQHLPRNAILDLHLCIFSLKSLQPLTVSWSIASLNTNISYTAQVWLGSSPCSSKVQIKTVQMVQKENENSVSFMTSSHS